jgi:hypothetical protein
MAPFEFPDFGHICGDAPSVLAFPRAIPALGLGRVVVFRHVRFLMIAMIGSSILLKYMMPES